MKKSSISGKLFMYLFFGILCFEFSFANTPDITKQVLGNGQFNSEFDRWNDLLFY